jgi:hypothetical protein
MGSQHSRCLSQWTCDDIATAAASLGDQYVQYSMLIRDKQVGGSYLASLSVSGMDDALCKLGVTSRLHRRVFCKKLAGLQGSFYELDSVGSLSSIESLSKQAIRRDPMRRVSSSDAYKPPPAVAFRRTQTMPEKKDRDELLRKMQLIALREQREYEELLEREEILLSQIAALSSAPHVGCC